MKYLIETQRLGLRPFELGDAAHMYLLNSNPKVLKYTGDPAFENEHSAREFLKNYSDYSAHGFGRWAVVRQSDGKWIGWCGLKRHDRFVDLGFRFFEEEWGKGYATEAAQACIHFGMNKLRLSEIVGRTMPENIASVRVLEKLGMEYYQTANCEGLHDAHWYRYPPKI